ncbi:hypothetical protein XOCgx_4831 [Xanthomonas oryzae pv. oryzicola]|nr:hypothetical protein XOCgx_4831 [Xanthomonas oryzae pv. oryzicola]
MVWKPSRWRNATRRNAAAATCSIRARALGDWALGEREVFSPVQMARLPEWLQRPTSLHAAIDEAVRQCAPARDNAHTQRHLLLVINHAEAMVATPGITDADRAALAAALQALCSSAHVAVLMLTRSDFYPRLIDTLPDIVALKRGDGHVDLLPPRDGAIGQIIRVPAAMPGLRFEEDRNSAAAWRMCCATPPHASPMHCRCCNTCCMPCMHSAATTAC